MRRRRFLTLMASSLPALTLPRGAGASVWQGTALGAEVSVTLTGPGAAAALTQVRTTLTRVESQFSLYRPSTLTALNAAGTQRLAGDFGIMCRLADQICRLTAGRFDPTVQPLWQALAQGGDSAAARALIGWDRVTLTPDRITLAPGQALTFNGIAQGYATDVVTAELAALGFSRALVNIGEYRARGGPWSIDIADPDFGTLGRMTLTDGAVATSSPGALQVGGVSHILSPDGTPPRWSTVSVSAPSAACADALSTAFCLMDRAAIRRTLDLLPGTGARLIDHDGNLVTA